MRVYRRYRCEHGHEWTVTTRKGEPETSQATYCPAGHEAVTCNEEEAATEVQIVLRPAAKIVDSVTGKTWDTGRYFVALLDRDDEELCVSQSHYTWDDATKLATLFKGKDPDRALELWRRKVP